MALIIYAKGADPDILERMRQRVLNDGFQEVLVFELGAVMTVHGGKGAMGITGFRREAAQTSALIKAGGNLSSILSNRRQNRNSIRGMPIFLAKYRKAAKLFSIPDPTGRWPGFIMLFQRWPDAQRTRPVVFNLTCF